MELQKHYDEAEDMAKLGSKRITPLELVSNIIKSSPQLFFINYMVKWLEHMNSGSHEAPEDSVQGDMDVEAKALNFNCNMEDVYRSGRKPG